MSSVRLWHNRATLLVHMVKIFPFFVLRFAFIIIHGSGKAREKRGRPGLIHHVRDVRWTRKCRKGEGPIFKYVRINSKSEFLTGEDE